MDECLDLQMIQPVEPNKHQAAPTFLMLPPPVQDGVYLQELPRLIPAIFLAAANRAEVRRTVCAGALADLLQPAERAARSAPQRWCCGAAWHAVFRHPWS